MTLVLIIAIVAVAVVAKIIEELRRRPTPPRPGDIWFASVAYSDDWTTSKDQPVLIVRVTGTTLMVRKITSQDKSNRPEQYEFYPAGTGGLQKPSWVKRQPEALSTRQLRRRIGCLRVPTLQR